jgi:hypothetical protein
MTMKVTAVPNEQKNGFHFPSQHNRKLLLDWFKKYPKFDITPHVEESVRSRGYLEGAVMPAYCEWQYGINSRDRSKHEQQRYLFKKDFNSEIVNDRDGNPTKAPLSSKGLASKLNDSYTRWAEQNGAPIPNPKLFKLWRDKYRSIDERFPTFFEFLDFLGIECDASPTPQQLAKLGKDVQVEYPEEDIDPDKIPF